MSTNRTSTCGNTVTGRSVTPGPATRRAHRAGTAASSSSAGTGRMLTDRRGARSAAGGGRRGLDVLRGCLVGTAPWTVGGLAEEGRAVGQDGVDLPALPTRA